VTWARRAARRAWSWVSATTMKIGWPTYITRPSARIGSSWMMGPQSFRPGMSSTVSTATTPALARTAARSSATMLACALDDRPSAACSVPWTSAMSSV
jgi:hypothetical protein